MSHVVPRAISLDVADGVGTITIHRPHRKNALTRDAMVELEHAVRAADRDPEIRVVVLTGEGTDFCAGADLGDEDAPLHPIDSMRVVNSCARAVQEFHKPLVARVDGVAVGAGWNLALLCDIVVASSRARFSQIFSRRGLSIDFGGSWIVSRVAGVAVAKRLALLGDIIDAEEARMLGLVSILTDPETLDETVRDIAQRLAAGPPIALSLTKSLIDHGAQSSFAQALEAEAAAQASNYATLDTREGFAAFTERRAAQFTGTWFEHA